MLSYRPRLEVLVLIGLLIVFTVGLGLSYTYLDRSQVYPRVICSIGIALTGLELLIFTLQVSRVNKFVPSLRTEAGGFLREVRAISPYVLWILVYFLIIYLIGLIIASAVWVFLFLVFVGKLKWYKAIVGGLAIGLAAYIIWQALNLSLPTAIYDVFHEFRNDLRLPF